jgi:hypothetical protein
LPDLPGLRVRQTLLKYAANMAKAASRFSTYFKNRSVRRFLAVTNVFVKMAALARSVL